MPDNIQEIVIKTGASAVFPCKYIKDDEARTPISLADYEIIVSFVNKRNEILKRCVIGDGITVLEYILYGVVVDETPTFTAPIGLPPELGGLYDTDTDTETAVIATADTNANVVEGSTGDVADTTIIDTVDVVDTLASIVEAPILDGGDGDNVTVWLPNTAYVEGDIVTSSIPCEANTSITQRYICITAHTSGAHTFCSDFLNNNSSNSVFWAKYEGTAPAVPPVDPGIIMYEGLFVINAGNTKDWPLGSIPVDILYRKDGLDVLTESFILKVIKGISR